MAPVRLLGYLSLTSGNEAWQGWMLLWQLGLKLNIC